MKTRFASAVVLLAAIGCLHAPTQSTAQSLTRTAGVDVPSTASTAPMYPVPRTLFAEVIARFSIGATHRAIYANITGNQMWFIVQSQFGRPNAQSAIDEARRLCEGHAVANKLDPGQCIPVAIDDRVVYDPGPLFSVADGIGAQQQSLRLSEDLPHQE